ncbi:MAG: hypothetical protein CVV64_13940 [Candidatus Wallbacteria bacterium HGW-Wallbacteria-1]|jgi:hypothetical protein|uniref:FMN-binding domain-containing protein n=1 Tax=Candidatus Wallbacteria bacterium HGW-Wallbacteria-1 TaxID=2013854 RepID=A0A2N1PMK2_9BACT|nr:MAG: hypothetical protein CVV64_13940 [Candidatus Wallbacteria bacterium HGW-Wallbacteria-1]
MALTFVSELTRPAREQQAEESLKKVVCSAAQINSEKYPIFRKQNRSGLRLLIREGAAETADKTITPRAHPLTVAIFTCPGLWDNITFALALEPGIINSGFADGRILGVSILSQKETPGLGGRIEETEFLDRFRGLSSESTIRFIKSGQSKISPGDLDGITGATMTCDFLAKGINRALSLIRNEKEQ